MGIFIYNQIDQSSVSASALGVIHVWSGTNWGIFAIKLGFIHSLDKVAVTAFSLPSMCTASNSKR